MKNLLKPVRKINRKPLRHARRRDIAENKFEGVNGPIDTQHLLISTLLPPAVKMFLEDCEREVDHLCGSRYKHGKSNQRWGSSNGSIILANQHVAIEKPRVRSKDGEEVKLSTYEEFQDPRLFDNAVFTEGLKKFLSVTMRRASRKSRVPLGSKKAPSHVDGSRLVWSNWWT